MLVMTAIQRACVLTQELQILQTSGGAEAEVPVLQNCV